MQITKATWICIILGEDNFYRPHARFEKILHEPGTQAMLEVLYNPSQWKRVGGTLALVNVFIAEAESVRASAANFLYERRVEIKRAGGEGRGGEVGRGGGGEGEEMRGDERQRTRRETNCV
ncbi:hypothetical protein RRG08_060056 [Elysia crispata]|uniref:Uncharacterized protein n=1 Tax=Elysia crispata TaxID=231223 RepID=A0AAE1CQH3_9GAST|nr:hypothetical protein RRG08_060056 [Elysia crispata]